MGWKDERDMHHMENVTRNEEPVDLPFPRIQVKKHIGTAGGGFSPVKRVLEWDVDLYGLDNAKQLVNVFFTLEEASKRADDLQRFHGWPIYYIAEHVEIVRTTSFKLLATQLSTGN